MRCFNPPARRKKKESRQSRLLTEGEIAFRVVFVYKPRCSAPVCYTRIHPGPRSGRMERKKNKKTLYTSVRPGRILSAGYMSWSVHTKSGSQVSQTVTKGLRLVRGCPRTSSSHLTPDGTGRAYFLHGLVKSWESKATLVYRKEIVCSFVWGTLWERR